MFDSLKIHCQQTMAFSDAELAAVDHYFVERSFKRHDFLLEASHVCRHLFFVAKGCVRHFHIKEDGSEATCDITLENQWATDFVSFADEMPSRLSLQALEDTVVYSVEKARLLELYAAHHRFETFGRITTERVLHRSIDTTMSLASLKPEERFKHLMAVRPELLQRVTQKHIASLLGISPESLSRLQKRMCDRRKT